MFKLISKFKPTGDQPQAISSIVKGLKDNFRHQCLEGVTGSGKTFTMANIIEKYNQPTLVLCHNKTLAAQLYEEFKEFFPNNSVEYFVSYYDYYQPEAYLPTTNTYIEKDLSINSEIEKFRINTTNSLLSEKKDVIVVASVSCIYGLGNPTFFKEKTIKIQEGTNYNRIKLIRDLVEAQYERTEENYLKSCEFKVLGDTFILYPSNEKNYYKIHFWGNQIERIEKVNGNKITLLKTLSIPPANIFTSSSERTKSAVSEIKKELKKQTNYFIKKGLLVEAKRIEDRVNYDLEMINEMGYCTGIENYSRYLDGRKKGSRPFCLMDYFSKDFLLFIDESHVTIPQIKAMYGGDKARKSTLVEYGFRLPSALDNRPLEFSEFEKIKKKVIYVSATPADYEYKKCEGLIVEQNIRPTGLLEPEILIQSSKNQIDHLMSQINNRIIKNERVLVTTLTKKMAEKLSEHLIEAGVKSTYIHSEVDTIDRVEIMKNLRLGTIDVLIGVNLLREGLDLPEVSLVAILDADKEGFLRSQRSLTQTIGRAARHISGQCILYADKITNSMQKTIEESHRKRTLQKKYNQQNNITPTPLSKHIQNNLLVTKEISQLKNQILNPNKLKILSKKDLRKKIREVKELMNSAALAMNFIDAAVHRDNLALLQKEIKKYN
tara:strand:+ start:24208 stop:26190 length:1983 start_codon:yes stop_codon:yes gene_type:complete